MTQINMITADLNEWNADDADQYDNRRFERVERR